MMSAPENAEKQKEDSGQYLFAMKYTYSPFMANNISIFQLDL